MNETKLYKVKQVIKFIHLEFKVSFETGDISAVS